MLIEARVLHSKTSNCPRIPVFKGITKDQVSEETVLTLFSPMVLIAFILSMKLTIACHDIVKDNSTFKSRAERCNKVCATDELQPKPSLVDHFSIYSLKKYFICLNFIETYHQQKKFHTEFS